MRNATSLSTPTSISPPWSRADQNLVRPQRETESTRQLSCDVVFGSPSADCMGTGVCRISARIGRNLAVSERTRNCKNTVGLLFQIEGGNGVALVLTRAMLCAQIYKNHLRRGTLTLENACPLPPHIAKTLGLKINELPIGEYRIQNAKGFLRIDFIASKFM